MFLSLHVLFWQVPIIVFWLSIEKAKHRSFTKRPFFLTLGNYFRVHCSFLCPFADFFLIFFCCVFSPLSLMHLLHQFIHLFFLKNVCPFNVLKAIVLSSAFNMRILCWIFLKCVRFHNGIIIIGVALINFINHHQLSSSTRSKCS